MKIGKYILIISCTFFFSLSELIAGDFKGGILAGFCASQMDGDRLGGYNKFGPTAGFFLHRLFDEKWGGQFELRYNQKGATGVISEIPYKVRLNYIEVPFLATYNLKKKIKFEAGFVPSILYRSKVLNGQIESNQQFYHRIDFPIAFGGYYSVSTKIDISIRFSYSTYPIRGNVTESNVLFYGYNQFNNAVNFVFYYYLK